MFTLVNGYFPVTPFQDRCRKPLFSHVPPISLSATPFQVRPPAHTFTSPVCEKGRGIDIGGLYHVPRETNPVDESKTSILASEPPLLPGTA